MGGMAVALVARSLLEASVSIASVTGAVVAAARGGRPRAGSDTTVTGAPASPIALRSTLTSMAIPALTHRSFWTRLVVFGASVLLYAWVVRLMSQEHSIIGTVLFSLLTLVSVAGLVATIVRRPR